MYIKNVQWLICWSKSPGLTWRFYVLFKKRAGVYYKVLKIGGEAEYVISNVNG